MLNLSQIIRKFLAQLIVDVVVEFYARTKEDPIFKKELTDSFTALDQAKSEEESANAAKAIRDLISS